MRSLTDVFMGALVFITIDRVCRVISSSIVEKGNDDNFVDRTMLRIELLTLILLMFIAVQFVKF